MYIKLTTMNACWPIVCLLWFIPGTT